MCGAVDHRDDGAVLAGDVDQAVRSESQRMRRDVGTQIDVADMGALFQVDDAQEVARIGIAAMDAVAEDRHIGKAGLRHHEQLVYRAGKAVQHDLSFESHGIEKQDLCADLVDGDDSARAVWARGHLLISLPLHLITVRALVERT